MYPLKKGRLTIQCDDIWSFVAFIILSGNCTMRQRVSRLVHKTLSFSKKLENHIGAIRTTYVF